MDQKDLCFIGAGISNCLLALQEKKKNQTLKIVIIEKSLWFENNEKLSLSQITELFKSQQVSLLFRKVKKISPQFLKLKIQKKTLKELLILECRKKNIEVLRGIEFQYFSNNLVHCDIDGQSYQIEAKKIMGNQFLELKTSFSRTDLSLV